MKLPDLYEKIAAVYAAHNNIIIAVDFDDTVYDWKNKGWECHKVVDLLLSAQEVLNTSIILFTCREGEKLEFAKNFLEERGVILHGVNENPDFPYTSSKPFYNILLDDKACLGECCLALQKLISCYDKRGEE